MYTSSLLLCLAVKALSKLLCCLASQAATRAPWWCDGVLAAFLCAATLDRPGISQIKIWDWWRGKVLCLCCFQSAKRAELKANVTNRYLSAGWLCPEQLAVIEYYLQRLEQEEDCMDVCKSICILLFISTASNGRASPW